MTFYFFCATYRTTPSKSIQNPKDFFHVNVIILRGQRELPTREELTPFIEGSKIQDGEDSCKEEAQIKKSTQGDRRNLVT